jgi:hypothetical protein
MIVLSVGGNDLLNNTNDDDMTSLMANHQKVVQYAKYKFNDCKVWICNLYIPFIDDAQIKRINRWNKFIQSYDNVIHLSTICNQPSDFVSDYEPSVSGGKKIADTLFLLQRKD